MQKQFQTITEDATIRDAMEKLYGAKSSGSGEPALQSLIVMDADGKLNGIVTMYDILEGIAPTYLKNAGGSQLAGITWEGLFEDSIQQAKSRAVSEIMTPRDEFHILAADDRVMKALELMVDEGATRLPVCEGDQVVGVVRIYELFQEVARELLNHEDEPE